MTMRRDYRRGGVAGRQSRLGLFVMFLAAGVAVAWTCFQAALRVKYGPTPVCYAGTSTPIVDPDKGWQCYKYWINDSDYGWVCIDGDNQTEAQMENTSVSVTEWGGFCTSTNCCGVNTNDVLHYKEQWPGTYCHQRSPCQGG